MALDDGNGKKLGIHELEIKNLHIADQQIIDGIRDIKKLLDIAFGPDGVCPKERSKNASVAAQLKIQWWFIAGISVALITLVLNKF
jgi:hypothetical protein